MLHSFNDRARIAVIGAGVSGLSCAWLLSRACDVTLYEAAPRLGGHSDTVDWNGVAVDNGFVVYNERTYPNLTALFAHFAVDTQATDMSFAVSLDQGRLEYSGSGLRGLVAQGSNVLRPRYWSMLKDILRFFRTARADADREDLGTLEQYLDRGGYGRPFRDDYLYPMAAAIWSTPAMDVGAQPAAAFIRFNLNHGLLDLFDRPQWRTVVGGSRSYVRRIAGEIGDTMVDAPVRGVIRREDGVAVVDAAGETRMFDQVVLATPADQALRLIDRPTRDERQLLGAFDYALNDAVMHTDARAMPQRRAAWSSWNYMADSALGLRRPSITYWMNLLQNIRERENVFVTLNPIVDIPAERIVRRAQYEHPTFTQETLAAQKRLWSLQGAGGLWFCGAYFGAGFHEDGLQAGLAVAEAIADVRRPWRVRDESGRIYLDATAPRAKADRVGALVQ
jgi:uncharacterized protein